MLLRTVLIRKAWLELKLFMDIVDWRRTRPRLPVLLGLAALHAVLPALFGPLSPQRSFVAEPPPLKVTLAQEDRTPLPELPQIAPQLIAPTPLPLMEPPEVELAEEPARSNAITMLPASAPAVSFAGRTVSIDDVGYVKAPRPRYPAESRRRAEHGLVLLLVFIDESGRVARVDVQSSSGHPRLDAAARDAVEHALFKPYLENGIARAVMATIPIEFSWKPRAERGGRS